VLLASSWLRCYASERRGNLATRVSQLVAHRCFFHFCCYSAALRLLVGDLQWVAWYVSHSRFSTVVGCAGVLHLRFHRVRSWWYTCFAGALACPALGVYLMDVFSSALPQHGIVCGAVHALPGTSVVGLKICQLPVAHHGFLLGQASCRSSASSVPGRWPVGTGLSSMARPGRTPSSCSSCCLFGGLGSAGYSMGYGCFLGVFIMLVCGSILALSIHSWGFGAECSCGCVLARASCSVADAL